MGSITKRYVRYKNGLPVLKEEEEVKNPNDWRQHVPAWVKKILDETRAGNLDKLFETVEDFYGTIAQWKYEGGQKQK